MTRTSSPTYTAFGQGLWLATGTAEDIVATLQAMPEMPKASDILVFDDHSGRQVDLDLRKSAEHLQATPSRGRPRLGVAAGEVTLLPRHWQWLKERPGGASAELRRLVEAAMMAPLSAAQGRDAAYRFLAAIAGDFEGFEAAIRAIYRDDQSAFDQASIGWPPAIRDHAAGFAWPVTS